MQGNFFETLILFACGCAAPLRAFAVQTSVSCSNAAAKINVRSHDTVSYEMMGMQMEETVFLGTEELPDNSNGWAEQVVCLSVPNEYQSQYQMPGTVMEVEVEFTTNGGSCSSSAGDNTALIDDVVVIPSDSACEFRWPCSQLGFLSRACGSLA